MTQKAANGAGTAIDVSNYEIITASIASENSAGPLAANLTVKCQGSISEAEPDWGSAASPTNVWDYIFMYDLDANNTVQGSTGVPFAAANATHQYKVNVDGLHWLNFIVSSYVAGKLTVKTYSLNPIK